MDFDSICPAAIQGLHLVTGLRSLHHIYQQVQMNEDAFCQSVKDRIDPAFGCVRGCGFCCDHFVPDILPVEADYLALWMLTRRPTLAMKVLNWGPPPDASADTDASAGCPLREGHPEVGQGHCAAYAGRPLVCRLFGFSGIYDKNGVPSYALCSQMKDLPGVAGRRFAGSQILEIFGRIPPVMSDYGEQLVAIDPEGASDRTSLPDILPRSLEKIGLLLNMAGVNPGASSNADDDPNAPGAPEVA